MACLVFRRSLSGSSVRRRTLTARCCATFLSRWIKTRCGWRFSPEMVNSTEALGVRMGDATISTDGSFNLMRTINTAPTKVIECLATWQTPRWRSHYVEFMNRAYQHYTPLLRIHCWIRSLPFIPSLVCIKLNTPSVWSQKRGFFYTPKSSWFLGGVWYDWGNELLERMTIQQSKNVESIKMVVFLGKMLSLPDGKFHCSWLVQNHYMGASQIIRSGTRSGTTPVPYPRSIPPFHTPVPYLFEGSVPYLCSIPLVHTSWYIYMIYIHNKYIFEHVQSDFTCVRTYLGAHTYMSANMQEYVYYGQALWLCWQVCACSTYSCYQLCCVMVGVCLAVASWQSKNCLLRYCRSKLPVLSNFDKDVLRGGRAVLEWAVSFQPVPYLFQTRTTHVPPLTHFRVNKWQVLTCT